MAAIQTEMHIQPTQQEEELMPGHRFNITVEALSDRQGKPRRKAPLVLKGDQSRRYISEIVKRIQARDDLNFGPEQSAAFAVRLKLFSEVIRKPANTRCSLRCASL